MPKLEPFTIGFNAKYLLDALAQIDGLMLVGLNGELDPVTLHAEGSPDVYVVMPMRI